MNHPRMQTLFVVAPMLAVVLASALALRAQEPPQDPTKEAAAQPPEQPRHRADGERHGLPLEAFAVTPGTKFLVSLQDDLNSKGTQENGVFKVKTLEPLEAGDGIYLPSGAEIVGHISRVEPAGVAGRAKLWLTFDEIHTKFGDLPIVAEVAGVPGDHSVKPVPNQEGLIAGRTSTQQDAAAAAAAGAASAP